MDSPDLLIRDFVFPLFLARRDPDGGISMERFLGTAFLIGSSGYALTAAHVVEIEIGAFQAIGGMFVDATNHWRGWNADVISVHPTEDITLLKLRGGTWPKSPLAVSFERQYSSMPYILFGYPQANLYEKVDDISTDGTVRGRPDLIYSAGHVRRRLPFTIPASRGSCFYELSQPVGSGCSGSPIIRVVNGQWNVVGIYVTDQILNVPYQTFDEHLNKRVGFLEMPGVLGFALAMDSVAEWLPVGLGGNLRTA